MSFELRSGHLHAPSLMIVNEHDVELQKLES